MSAARERILARVTEAAVRNRVPEPPATAMPSRSNAAPEALVARFLSELRLLEVEAFEEGETARVQERVASLLGAGPVFGWEPETLPYGLGSVISGIPRVSGEADKRRKAEAGAGLTGVDAACAETGSLILLSRPGQPRTASLLPYTHIAVVRRDQIVARLSDWLAASRSVIESVAQLTVITGQSRTADIELRLTLGVHGPGLLRVVVGP
jgi:L-lactate dehydrogenase complex protein LldG